MGLGDDDLEGLEAPDGSALPPPRALAGVEDLFQDGVTSSSSYSPFGAVTDDTATTFARRSHLQFLEDSMYQAPPSTEAVATTTTTTDKTSAPTPTPTPALALIPQAITT